MSKCDDCFDAYRDYLCAVAVPRCDDAPPAAELNDSIPDSFDSNGELIASWLLPDSYQTSLVRDEPFASRTPLFGPANLSSTFPSLFNNSYPPDPENLAHESPFPYSEIPPCLDVCNLVQARCPPFLNFVCPKTDGSGPRGGTGTAAWGQTRSVPSTERLANDVYGSSLHHRAADRWGNVLSVPPSSCRPSRVRAVRPADFATPRSCNALQSDLTMALQFIDPFAKDPFDAPRPKKPPSPDARQTGSRA